MTDILIGIAHSVIIAPFVGIIAVPPKELRRNFLLNDTVLAKAETVFTVIFGILDTRCYPVAIAEHSFLDVFGNTTINLDRRILATTQSIHSSIQ